MRSTSKIDALDDDETPLRLTASQTDTSRGMMVSGIMDAFDIAPTFHFVEPGLKIIAGGWIKVMDEYIVPNCTALMEPGRKFLLILDNAPSHVSRLACEHCSTVLHGSVEFQPPCSPDLSPLDFFLWNELKVQLVQHPAPVNPAELRALLICVCHRTWTGGRCMLEKMGNAWLRRLKACVAARGGFFLNSDHEISHRAAQRHSAKNTSLNTSFHTPWHAAQTLTAPQTQTTRGETLLFCHTSLHQKFRALNLKMGQEVPKTLKTGPLPHYFLTTVPQMVENTVQK